MCWVLWDRVLWTIYLGWLQTAILLIFAFWVARTAGMSHWCQAALFLFTVTLITERFCDQLCGVYHILSIIQWTLTGCSILPPILLIEWLQIGVLRTPPTLVKLIC
jgi:hypothetical protein